MAARVSNFIYILTNGKDGKNVYDFLVDSKYKGWNLGQSLMTSMQHHLDPGFLNMLTGPTSRIHDTHKQRMRHEVSHYCIHYTKSESSQSIKIRSGWESSKSVIRMRKDKRDSVQIQWRFRLWIELDLTTTFASVIFYQFKHYEWQQEKSVEEVASKGNHNENFSQIHLQEKRFWYYLWDYKSRVIC